MKFIFDVICLSRPGKSVNPNLRQYQSYRNNDKFNCCLEIQQQKSARVSTCTLNTLKQHSNQIHIWCQFLAVAQLLRQPPHFQVTILKKNKFTCCFRNHRKMAAIISIPPLFFWWKVKIIFLSDGNINLTEIITSVSSSNSSSCSSSNSNSSSSSTSSSSNLYL